MSVLCCMAVTLSLLLAAGNSLAAADQNQLAGTVDEILNRYRPSYRGDRGNRRYPMFSLIVSIPYDSDRKMYDISQVPDPGDEVRDTILKCEVYTGTRVVAATVLRWPNVVSQCPDERVQWRHVLSQCGQTSMTWIEVQEKCPKAVRDGEADHAEYRTLQHFNTLVNSHNKNDEDLLLFYVLASPCTTRCTSESSPRSILNSINQILRWKKYAVVFSKVFKPRSGKPIPEGELRGALERLATHKGPSGRSVGLDNIFICDGPPGQTQCTSCSTNGQVAHKCFSYEPQAEEN